MERSDDFLDLIHYWQLLSRSLWWMVGLTLLAGAAGYGVSKYLLKPLYKAESVIYVGNTDKSSSMGMAALLGEAGLSLAGLGSTAESVNPVAILKSKTAKREVCKRLGIKEGEQSIKVVMGKEGTITITASARSPQVAADVANTYVAVLREWREKGESSAARRKQRFIEGQLATTRTELKKAEEALRAFQERHGIMTPDTSITLLSEGILNTQKELARARLGLGQARESLDTLRAKLRQRATFEDGHFIASTGQVGALSSSTSGARTPSSSPSGQAGDPSSSTSGQASSHPISNDPLTGKLRSSIADLEAELAVARLTLTEEHPHVTQLRQQLEILRKQLRDTVAKMVSATDAGILPELIEHEVAIAVGEATVAALEREDEKLAGEVARIPEGALSFLRLKREAAIQESVYQMLLQEYYKARIAAAQDAPPITVVDPAVPPKGNSMRLVLHMMLAMFLTFTLSVGMVLLRDWTATLRRIAYTRQKQQAARE